MTALLLVAIAARHPDEAHSLRRAGAALVLMPFADAADFAVDLLHSSFAAAGN